MSATLRRLGFEVIPGTDLDEAAFYDRIAAFDIVVRVAAIALFFYAGHGMQAGGRNYLNPVDLRLETRQDLRRHAIELSAVTEAMRGETNVVILEACRDNPLAGQLARSLGMSRAAAASRGLARAGGTIAPGSRRTCTEGGNGSSAPTFWTAVACRRQSAVPGVQLLYRAWRLVHVYLDGQLG